jgi:hypothetical protein
MQTQGREIGEIKRELKDVATKMTEVATILPHLVTKEHCAEARGDTVHIKLTAAIVSLIGVLLGMTTFVVKTFQRQERTDRVLRTLIENQQRQLQQQQAPPAPPPQLEVATP